MIVVDDYLTRRIVLGDRRAIPGDEALATTWGFHYRLVRALVDSRQAGTLSQGDPTEALFAVSQAPRYGVAVLDPRGLTEVAAELAITHRLNLLTAELVAAAQVHDAEVVLTERNVGRRWPGLFDELGLTLTVV